MMSGLVDRIAARLGIWALHRLFGACATDVRDDFPDERIDCTGCDSARLIRAMQEFASDA